jgi:hypothetical protein
MPSILEYMRGMGGVCEGVQAGNAADRETGARLALKTLGRVAVSLDASPLPEMMVTVGRDMVGVVDVAES